VAGAIKVIDSRQVSPAVMAEVDLKTFAEPRVGQISTASFDMRMADGGEVPPWMTIDTERSMLVALPPVGANGYVNVIIVVKMDGRDVEIPLRLEIGQGAQGRNGAVSADFAAQLTRASDQYLSREVERQVRQIIGE
jgi:hypothetical protein